MKYNVSSFIEEMISNLVYFLFKTDNMILNIHNIENINQFMIHLKLLCIFQIMTSLHICLNANLINIHTMMVFAIHECKYVRN